MLKVVTSINKSKLLLLRNPLARFSALKKVLLADPIDPICK